VKPRLDPRVFLALPISRTVQGRIGAIQEDLKQYLTSWHFIPPINLHVTLRFFGEVPESKVSHIDAICQELAPTLPPLTVSWDRLDFFGTPKAARVLFIAAGDCPELKELARRIRDVFPDKEVRKSFRPHVTIAKARQHLNPNAARMNANMLRRLAEHGRIGPQSIEVDFTTVHRDFVMLETIWVGRGVEYEVRARYQMGGG